jgi:hypothetical protein
MSSTAATAAEVMFSEILKGAGYKDLAPSFDKNTLLNVGRELRPGSMSKVEEEFKRQGRAFKWHLMPERFILDRIFAVDSIVAPSGQRGVNFAFDVTLNPEEVTSKVEKHRHLYNTGVWDKAGLGIVKSAVILLIPSPSWQNCWGWGLLSEAQKDALTEELIDILVAMDERTSIVTKWTITF